MRLIVGAIGKIKSGPEAELAARYGERFAQRGRTIGLAGPEVFELPESRAGKAGQRKIDEAQRMLEKLPERVAIILFDESGKSISSRDFAETVSKHADGGTSDLALLIGGPDGHDASLHGRAQHVFSFGKLTIPHQIVRILVMEQLYRATTILSNHPYHRD